MSLPVVYQNNTHSFYGANVQRALWVLDYNNNTSFSLLSVTATDPDNKYDFSFMPCKAAVCEGTTGDPSVVSCTFFVSECVLWYRG